MENNELRKIWKNSELDIERRSKEELELLLRSKTRQTLNKYISIISISVLISLVLIVLLIIASLNRQGDTLYIINNSILGLLTLISFVSGIVSWKKLQIDKFNSTLKSVLEEKVTILSKWLKTGLSKIYFISIPVLYILLVISIHVYFEYKGLIEVFKTDESLIGLIVAAPIGLFVSFYVVRKIRKFQMDNLFFMEDMLKRLSENDSVNTTS